MKQEEYDSIADILRPRIMNLNGDSGKDYEVIEIAKEFADYFVKEDKDQIIDSSDEFDKERFLKKCGVKE